MESGQNGEGSKWKVVKMKSDQNKKYRQVITTKSVQNEKWSEWKVVRIESSQNGK